MKDIQNKTILITGASSGIGRAFARLFSGLGNDLVIVARRVDRLEALKSELEKSSTGNITVIDQDLSEPDAVKKVVGKLATLNINIDVLVNNAGYSLQGKYHELELQELLDLVQVNNLSPMQLIHSLLPGMVEREYGRILNIASIAGGFYAYPNHTTYVAAKTFLVRLSISLNEEYRKNNVIFTAVLPGVVASEFHTRAGTQAAYESTPGFMVMSAEEAARLSYEAMKAGKPYYIPGSVNKIIVSLVKLLPIPTGISLLQKSF